jgi:hypothetical protein
MIYMKKLVAISVLFAILTVAVFAQDDEGKWKVGFSAEFISDMLYTASMKAKSTYTPSSGTANTAEFGNYNKGVVSFFGNGPSITGFDPRLMMSLSNSGENYSVFASIDMDNWWKKHHETFSVWTFLQGAALTDWYAEGTAGIFYGVIGTKGFGGFVDTQANWGAGRNWLGGDERNNLNLFGVYRSGGGFIVSDQFRTWPQWGAAAALSASFTDNFRFALGYKLDPDYGDEWGPNSLKKNGSWADYIDPTYSHSNINASFMITVRPADAITFDLFYSVIGFDEDTMQRPAPAAGSRYAAPEASWANTIGAFIGLNIVENLGLSLGYTVNFNAYEKGSYLGTETGAVSKPVTYNAPIYSGIDLHIKYSGIENIGLTFSNNVSLAGVKGQKNYNDPNPADSYDTLILGLGEIGATGPSLLGEGRTQDWFHWHGQLTAELGFIEGVNLVFVLSDVLSATTTVSDLPAPTSTKSTNKYTENKLRATLGAETGAGGVTIGAGLTFALTSYQRDYEYTATGGTTKATASSDVLEFGIPLYVKVSF